MIIDDFTGTNGDDFSKEWWYDAAGNSGTGSTVIDDNEAQMTISSGNNGNHYKTLNRIIKGDFEIEFDFVTVTGQVVSIQQGGVYISPNKDSNTSEWCFVGLKRQTYPYAYFRYDDTGSNDSWDEINISSKSNPYTNQFRIKRVGNQVSAYYKNEEDGSWSQIGSAHTWIEDDIYFGFFAYRNNTSATPLVYTFDNFAINNCDIIIPWNISETGEVSAQNVWDENFVAAYHMSQSPTGSILDSTSNENHATSYGSMTNDDLVDSDFGKGINFDGSNDAIRDIDVGSPFTGITVMAHCLFSAWTANPMRMISKFSGADGIGSGTWVFDIYDGDFRFYTVDGNSFPDVSPLTLYVYYNFCGTIEAGTKVQYLDGVELKSQAASNPGNSSQTISIGEDDPEGLASEYFNGIMNEVQISKIGRSAAWIKATNAVLNNTLLIEGSSSSSSSSTSTIPLSSGLYTYWSFDGDYTDKIGNQDATGNGTDFTSTAVINQSVNIDSEDYVFGGTSLLAGWTQFSISFWVYFDTLPSNDEELIRKADVHDSSAPFLLWRDEDTTNHLAWLINDNGLDDIGVQYSDWVPSTGSWNHIVFTFDANNEVHLYINGTEDTASPWTITLVSEVQSGTDNFVLGKNDDSDKNFDGKMDEFGIWYNRVLTSDEVSQLYNSGNGLGFNDLG